MDVIRSGINQAGDGEETSLMPHLEAKLPYFTSRDSPRTAGIARPSNNKINQNIRVLSICNFLSGLSRIWNQMFPASRRCFSSAPLFLSFSLSLPLPVSFSSCVTPPLPLPFAFKINVSPEKKRERERKEAYKKWNVLFAQGSSLFCIDREAQAAPGHLRLSLFFLCDILPPHLCLSSMPPSKAGGSKQ